MTQLCAKLVVLVQQGCKAVAGAQDTHAILGECVDLKHSPLGQTGTWIAFRAHTALPYTCASNVMQSWQDRVIAGQEHRFLIWLCEHEPVYTAGTSAHLHDDITHDQKVLNGLPLLRTGRGGRLTYHGPGQRIVYVVCALDVLGLSLHAYVDALARWGARVLQAFDMDVAIAQDAPGVWARPPGVPKNALYMTQSDLIAGGFRKVVSIGVRVRKGVTCHGFAINGAVFAEHLHSVRLCGLDSGLVASVVDVCPLLASQQIVSTIDACVLDDQLIHRSDVGSTAPPPREYKKKQQYQECVGETECYGCD